MSIKYEEQIKQINDSKENIARAIALAVYDGDEKKAEKAENYFRNILVNETKTFIVDYDVLHTKYYMDLKAIINEISEVVGYDVSKFALSKFTINKQQVINKQIVDKNLFKEKSTNNLAGP